jgi:hypothetical protein
MWLPVTHVKPSPTVKFNGGLDDKPFAGNNGEDETLPAEETHLDINSTTWYVPVLS